MQLEKRAKEIHSSIICGIVNENIQNEKKIKVDMSAQFRDDYEAFEVRMPYSNIKRKLNNVIHFAWKEIEQTKKTLEGQRMVLMDLQTENQSLENRVFEAIQIRDQKKRPVGNAQCKALMWPLVNISNDINKKCFFCLINVKIEL